MNGIQTLKDLKLIVVWVVVKFQMSNVFISRSLEFQINRSSLHFNHLAYAYFLLHLTGSLNRVSGSN